MPAISCEFEVTRFGISEFHFSADANPGWEKMRQAKDYENTWKSNVAISASKKLLASITSNQLDIDLCAGSYHSLSVSDFATFQIAGHIAQAVPKLQQEWTWAINPTFWAQIKRMSKNSSLSQALRGEADNKAQVICLALHSDPVHLLKYLESKFSKVDDELVIEMLISDCVASNKSLNTISGSQNSDFWVPGSEDIMWFQQVESRDAVAVQEPPISSSLVPTTRRGIIANANAVDQEDLIAHEFGHYFGLMHLGIDEYLRRRAGDDKWLKKRNTFVPGPSRVSTACARSNSPQTDCDCVDSDLLTTGVADTVPGDVLATPWVKRQLKTGTPVRSCEPGKFLSLVNLMNDTLVFENSDYKLSQGQVDRANQTIATMRSRRP